MRSFSLFRIVLIVLGLSVPVNFGAAADGSAPGPESSSLTMFGMALIGLAMLSRLSRYVPMSNLSSEAIKCQIISVRVRN
jgi:hypothetical protein